MAMSSLQYAEDNNALLPESHGTMSFDLRKNFEFDTLNNKLISIRKDGAPLPLGGLGHLTNGYLDSERWSDVFHCPSHQTMESVHPGHGMDVGPGTNRWGLGVSWIKSPEYKSERIIMSYQYRGSSYESRFKTPLSIRDGVPKQIIIFDSLQTAFGIQFGHKTGYGTMFLDGSYYWFEDHYKGWVDTHLDGYMNNGLRPNSIEEDFYHKWEKMITEDRSHSGDSR